MSIINEDFNNYYDWTSYQVDIAGLYDQIEKSRTHYSDSLIQTIYLMLGQNENTRVDLNRLIDIASTGGRALANYQYQGGVLGARDTNRTAQYQSYSAIQPMKNPLRAQQSYKTQFMEDDYMDNDFYGPSMSHVSFF